jgi:cytosine/creatinine deaminase
MDRFMELAIEEARATKAQGGLPYGAVLTRNGQIIGVGRNMSVQTSDPTSHAEMEAIRNARLQESYSDTVMYASAFPCLMCAGAIVRMGIPKVIIGASWDHSHSSREFMQSHGVELVELHLAECQQLIG